MSVPYAVKQGDNLSKIAKMHGVRSWQELYGIIINPLQRTGAIGVWQLGGQISGEGWFCPCC
jgi:hypothetical protein